MEEKENYLNKVICLFFPPLLNGFKLSSQTGIKFFNYQETGEINQFLAKLSDNEKKIAKLVLINYPHHEKQIDKLQEELAKIDRNITNIVLLDWENYEVMVELQQKYLICPNCEKVFLRETVGQVSEQFVCSQDGKKFTLNQVNKFIASCLENYFKNRKNLIEKILTGQEKTAPVKVSRLTIRKSEEVFSDKIREKLEELINNI